MANDGKAQTESGSQAALSVGERFPSLRQLEEDVERAKLEQALAEARVAGSKAGIPTGAVDQAKLEKELAEAQAAAAKAKLPTLDVDVARDTVGMSDKTTGIASVLVQFDSIALADDIAELALDAARADATGSDSEFRYSIRVVADPAALSGVDVFRLLEGQLRHLVTRLDEIAPSQPPKSQEPRKAGPERKALVPLAVAAPAISLGVSAIGLVSKLIAREYQISGSAVTGELGFDLETAHYLIGKARPDEDVEVTVDRLLPTPASSEIIGRLWELATSSDVRLVPAVAASSSKLAEARSEVETVKSAVVALNAEIIELTKLVPALPQNGSTKTRKRPDSEGTDESAGVAPLLRELTERRKTLEEGLPELESALAVARDEYDRFTGLLTDVKDFLRAALSPGTTGNRPPAFEAARAEDLATGADTGTYVLYVRLIAGGIDRTIETKLGPDYFHTLAGVTAEFALLAPGGRILETGTRSALQSSTMKLTDPGTFRQSRPNYVGRDRA